MPPRTRGTAVAQDSPVEPNETNPPSQTLDETDLDLLDDIEHLTMEQRIQQAMAVIESGLMSQRKAAIYYAVARGTLQGRLKGAVGRAEAQIEKRKLSVPQEEVLVEWIKTLGRRGIPLTLSDIGAYAADIYRAPLGITWPIRFKRRHPDLKIKWTNSLEECRARALNPTTVHNYFELLRETIEEFDVKPQNIWNMDEKGIQLGVGDRVPALVDRDQKVVSKIESGNRDLVTIIECISATGNAIRPGVVFQGKRRDLRWGEDNPCHASISISERGWTDHELGSLWMEKDFASESAKFLDDPGDYRLLIVDGNSSHCTHRFVTFAQKHRIVVLRLPAHTTHALQPCDVGVFSPLASCWKSRVSEQHRIGILIDKYNLLSNYAVARDKALTKSNIIAAFRKCGIEPLDEDAIPKVAFAPALNYDTRAAMPVGACLPALLVPVDPNSTPSTTPVQSHSSGTSIPSTPTSSPTRPSTPINRSASQFPPCTPTASAPAPPAPNEEAMQAAYAIAMPSPVKKTASRRALATENDQLRSLLKAAGVDLERNYTQMKLMERENANLRQGLYAKKNKRKPEFSDAAARQMTSDENIDALWNQLIRKRWKVVFSDLKENVFPERKKKIDDAVKAAQAAIKAAAKQAKEAAREAVKVAKAAEKEAAKAARAEMKAKKAAEREEAKIARAAARARGRGRGGAGRGRGRAGAARGRGRGRAEAQYSSDEDEPSEESSAEETDLEELDATLEPLADAESEPSDEEEDNPLAMSPSRATDLPSDTETHSDDDDEADDEEEIGVASLNGHRWKQRRDLEFQVVWTDGDVTWEPLESVNDCAGLEAYLGRMNIDDPLLLSRRKYLIDSKLKASNE